MRTAASLDSRSAAVASLSAILSILPDVTWAVLVSRLYRDESRVINEY
jgi:hypothetical protein